MRRIDLIENSDSFFYKKAKEHFDSIAKPIGSFGLLEDTVCRIAAIQRTECPEIKKRTAVIMCADHGVVEEGVTQCGSEVTAKCAEDIAEGRSNINAVAGAFDTEVLAADVGIAEECSHSKLLDRRIAPGTKNMTKGAAMTEEQLKAALTAGMDIAKEQSEKGTQILIAGEMGIGNTTSASAMSSVILSKDAETVTGRGAGLSTEGLKRKIKAVRRAVRINSPEKNKPLDILRTLGGFETAAMTGLFLGGAYYRIPVIADGFISLTSAVVAVMINEKCRDYIFASHCSDEPAAKMLLERLGVKAVIYGGLRLGEGTGGVLLLPLIDGALALYYNSHRFEDISMERYVELE